VDFISIPTNQQQSGKTKERQQVLIDLVTTWHWSSLRGVYSYERSLFSRMAAFFWFTARATLVNINHNPPTSEDKERRIDVLRN
jgi:hypothetical protein